MNKPIDRTGQRFGRLVATAWAGGRRWLFTCDCGVAVERDMYKVATGNTTSCGCFRREFHAANNSTHGGARRAGKSPEYTAWRRAKMRCHTPTNPDFPQYGGRGIVMCDEWRANFEVFLAHIGPRPRGGTLDRIDVNGDYAPGNVRWATRAVQSVNRQNTLYVQIGGKKMPMIEACRAAGASYHKVHYWMHRRGMGFDEAVTHALARS